MIKHFNEIFLKKLVAEQHRQEEAALALKAQSMIEEEEAKLKAAQMKAKEDDQARNLTDIAMAQDKSMNYLCCTIFVHIFLVAF